jgi:predicted dehydrogenase
VIVGLGIQGRKRVRIASEDVVATVDPVMADARFKTVEQVPFGLYDAALVCTPDESKLALLSYLLSHGKHVLVEKPLLAEDPEGILQLQKTARSKGAICYTAYNHRFEPHLVNLKALLDSGALGKLYLAKFFYGNGTARDVRNSPWRDKGLGVLTDLGSHLLDLVLFLFGQSPRAFVPWKANRFENRANDHVVFGASGEPFCECEMMLLSWKNTFSVEVYGELGSAHVQGLCKWGPSHLIVRRRVFPSGKPGEDAQVIESPDPTWKAEYEHFQKLCENGETNLTNDIWIQSALNELERGLNGN